jgi:uncharacterized protein (TIGR03437 family)
VIQISPNGLFAVIGERFTTSEGRKAAGPEDLIEGRVPDILAGACVMVGERAAPVLSVERGLIIAQTPSDTPLGETTVQAVTGCRGTAEVKSNSLTVSVAAVSPEFLFFKTNPDGRNPARAINPETGAPVGSEDLIPGQSAPARPGATVGLILTGLGVTDPALQSGIIPDAQAPLIERPVVLLGDAELPADRLVYAGVRPGAAGEYMVTITVPEDAPEGDVPVTVRIGGVSTPAGAYLTVKK